MRAPDHLRHGADDPDAHHDRDARAQTDGDRRKDACPHRDDPRCVVCHGRQNGQGAPRSSGKNRRGHRSKGGHRSNRGRAYDPSRCVDRHQHDQDGHPGRGCARLEGVMASRFGCRATNRQPQRRCPLPCPARSFHSGVHARCNGPLTRNGHPTLGGHFVKEVRRCPTLPQGPPCSTIGAERLSFRVRNGTGRFPLAMAAETLLMFQSAQQKSLSCGSRPYIENHSVDASTKKRCVIKSSAY